MWQFVDKGDNIAKSDEFTYLGDKEPTSTFNMPDGNATFHFAYKDLYADGTTVEKHNYIIDDAGKIQTFSDISSSGASAAQIKEKILTLNFESVYTSNLFSDKWDKKIYLIFSSKLLTDARILQLPSSLSQSPGTN